MSALGFVALGLAVCAAVLAGGCLRLGYRRREARELAEAEDFIAGLHRPAPRRAPGDRVLSWEGGELRVLCPACDEVIERYSGPVGLDQVVGDAYSDHMHDEDLNPSDAPEEP